MNPIRILVADDHPVVREGLIAILTTQPDFEIVGEAGDGRQALELASQHQPDLLLLDLEMPHKDGVQTLLQLPAHAPNCKAIVFTAYDSDERIVSAVKSGAKGYLLKGVPREELFNAIRVVQSGGSLLQPVIAGKLMAHMTRRETAPTTEPLTDREMEVLNQMALGRQNKEIALTLVISERTVKFHVSSILQKLAAGNRTEAVANALQLGLITLRE